MHWLYSKEEEKGEGTRSPEFYPVANRAVGFY